MNRKNGGVGAGTILQRPVSEGLSTRLNGAALTSLLRPTHIDRALTSETLYRSFAHGLDRWHGFAEACPTETGPAGVLSRGRSKAEAGRWSEAERWRAVWAGNPMEAVRMVGHSRLAVATSHVSGLALS